MAGSIEAITVLASIEAVDKATDILSGIFGKIGEITGAFGAAGKAAQEAGTYFAGSQYEAMSAAERLVAMETMVADREAMVAEAALRVAEAQRVAATAFEESASAAARVADVNETVRIESLRASAAQKDAAVIARELADAEGFEADVLRSALVVAQQEATVATERLATAQKLAADVIEEEGVKTRLAASAQRDVRIAQDEATAAGIALKDAQTGLGVAQNEVNTKAEAQKKAVEGGTTAMLGIGAATVAVAGYSVDLASKFQEQTQVLVSGAGVSENQIDGVRKVIMQTAQDTGTSTKDLSDAFFALNSRLGDVNESEKTLALSAELAQAHHSSLKDTATALANAMNAYHVSADGAASVSNILGVAVERGGMSMQQLSTALSKVAPVAHSAGVSLEQATAAMAVMTGEGMSADTAAQYLTHTIEKMQGPTGQMISTWGQMGLTQKQVTDALHGPGGLQSAMELVSGAASKLVVNGEVVVSTFKQSRDASDQLNKMMSSMDPTVKALAQRLQDNSISVKEYNKAAMDMGGANEAQAKQFEALYTKMNGFNDAVKAGKPGFSDFDALMKSAYGDATSYQTALLLGGDASKKWGDITKEAGDSAAHANGQVAGWAQMQATLSVKMNEAKAAISNAGIALGTALLPAVTKIVQELTPYIEKAAMFIQHHQKIAELAVKVGLALGAIAVSIKAAGMAMTILNPLLALFSAELQTTGIPIIVIAIAALVIGLIELYKHCATARAIMNEFGEYLKVGLKLAIEIGKEAIHLLGEVIRAVIDWFKAHKDEFSAAWDQVMKAVHAIAKWFDDNVVKYIKQIVGELITWWKDHTKEIHEVWKFIWTMIKLDLQLSWDFIKGALQTLMGYWDLIWGLIRDTVILVWDGIKDAVKFGIDMVKDVIGIALDLITGHWGQAWKDLKGLVVDAWNDVTGFLGDIAANTWHLLEDAGKNLIKGLINGIKSMASSAEGAVKDVVSSIRDYLPFSPAKKGPLSGTGGFDYAGKTMGKMLADGMHYSIPQVNSAAEAMASVASVTAMANLGISSGAGAFNAAGRSAFTGVVAGNLGLSPVMGGSTGGSTEIHVHLDQGSLAGTVITDPRALDQFTQRLGYHIATKALPGAGVRMHY